jgi:serine O-acetyltransferase
MANTIFKYEYERKESARVVCDKIYGQAKSMSGCDLYFEVEMPEVFFFDHPLGSHLGRAKYGNNFSFIQGCTVDDKDGKFPEIGNNVVMLTGSKIIGDSCIGDNCIISEGTIIVDEKIGANSIVYGKSPNLIIDAR